MDNKEIQSEVIEFVAEFRNRPVEKIKLETSILEDLGIDGDIADDLFVEYAEKFKVNMTEFDFKKHFGPESSIFAPFTMVLAIFYKIYCLIFSETKSFSERFFNLQPVTIRDLVESAKVGKWQKA